jgi:hypothetical protein
MFVFTDADGSPEFAMEHLAAVIEQARSGETTDEPDYRINVWGSLVGGGGWGGVLGHYRLPRDGQPGWLVPHAWNLNEPNIYYETTPGFDAFVGAAIDVELAERAERAANRPAAPAAVADADARSDALMREQGPGGGPSGSDNSSEARATGNSRWQAFLLAALGLAVAGAAMGAWRVVASR